MQGRVHSIQSLGALDGPGIRYTVFLSGCNLRCGCCHNPDTWDIGAAKEYDASEIVNNALRYREYFGDEGGITLSGGEPLLQAEFAKEVFTLAKNSGLNTCLDTSGSLINESVRGLLLVTDRVLLDLKYTSEEEYQSYVGCSLGAPMKFLEVLCQMNIKTTVRQVIIPTLNDSEESLARLKSLTRGYSCIDKFEFLPFKKMCRVKYEALGLEFPFERFPEPSDKDISKIEGYFFSL